MEKIQSKFLDYIGASIVEQSVENNPCGDSSEGWGTLVGRSEAYHDDMSRGMCEKMIVSGARNILEADSAMQIVLASNPKESDELPSIQKEIPLRFNEEGNWIEPFIEIVSYTGGKSVWVMNKEWVSAKYTICFSAGECGIRYFSTIEDDYGNRVMRWRASRKGIKSPGSVRCWFIKTPRPD